MKKVYSKDGTAIAFDQSGQGPALILVTGAIATRADAASLAATLSSHFAVFAYDRRGRGESGDTLPYTVKREIEDLDALIAEAGGAAFVFGHSSGAALALEAAARGLAIPKLAVYEPPYFVDRNHPPVPEDFAEQLTELISSGRRGDAAEFFMTKMVEVPVEAVAQMRGTPFWPSVEVVAHTLVYDTTIMGKNNALPADRLASVTIPTLVIDGGESPAWIRNTARVIADTLPNAQHRTLKGQTHGAADEVLAPVLMGFFIS